VVNYSPETAVQWLQTIGDDNIRNSRSEMIARRWLDSDPQAARQWINQSSLSPELKENLLNAPQPGFGPGPTTIRPSPGFRMDPRLMQRYGIRP
jgi:hypothetical protein